MLDVEKAKRIYDLIDALREVNHEIRALEIDVRSALRTHISFGVPADVVRGVGIKIERRRFRDVKLAPLRCEETPVYIDEVVIDELDMVLRGDSFKHSIRLTQLTIYDLLTLACNLEVGELEALINAVREKKRELEEDFNKLKELIAYAKLVVE
jgi:hypothetical protein